jgi:alginate O-acetyltransferase complex protein AlgI
MLFNSFEFLVLISCAFALYYTPGFSRFQIPILLGASLIFYGSFQPTLLLLLLLSLAINIITSHLVIIGPPDRRRTYATLGVVFNLCILIFFKYGPLFVNTMPIDTGTLGAYMVTLPLPLGISFFTFHGITLLVDTFRARAQAISLQPREHFLAKHASNVSLYFLFFPQLVAGPITKSRNFLPQIQTKHFVDIDWEYAFRTVTLGYFLKMVVADSLAQQTFWISYPYFLSFSGPDLLIMLGGYSMQIFADFAGYSLIAIGIAALFGYKLPENFNFPYIAQSFSEFWTRWHISLSSFLKEYLYIPLGGSRQGRLRTYFNLFVVMLLGGLWHGAAWSFMVWGGVHGLALAAERMLGDRIHLPPNFAVRVIKVGFVFTYVSLAWLLFKLPDFGNVIEYIAALFHNWTGGGSTDPDLRWFIALYSIPVVAYHFVHRGRWAVLNRGPLAAAIYGTMIFLIMTNSGEPQSFVYFQF